MPHTRSALALISIWECSSFIGATSLLGRSSCLVAGRVGKVATPSLGGRAEAWQLRPYDGVPTRGRAETPLTSLLAHHERMGSHVPEALVLAGDQHCYEGHQVAEQSVHDAKQCPYCRTTKAGSLAIVLPYYLYPEHHLANRLP